MEYLKYNTPRNEKEVVTLADKRNVTFINLWYIDVLGQLNSINIHRRELEDVLENGKGIDGSSIDGFTDIHQSDLTIFPKSNTFEILPYRPIDKDLTARIFCSVCKTKGKGYERFEGDPMFALERMEKKIKEKYGFIFYVGTESEFFIFKNNRVDDLDDNPSNLEKKVIDHAGYCKVADDEGVDSRRGAILYLEAMHIPVEFSHHEVASSQNELVLKYDKASNMAEKVATYRRIVKIAAKEQGWYATFMPKPIYKKVDTSTNIKFNGSGMHVHQSLFKDGKNIFYDKNGRYYLSETAMSYIAGVLKHAPEICAVLAQWVNSYKRLVPNFEAPTEIACAQSNRSTSVRIPDLRPGKEKARRIEVRIPDPACNPALAFLVMLAAGMKGIEEGYKMPEPVEEDIYKLSKKEKMELGIESLPGTLKEATKLVKNSELVRDALGEYIHSRLVELQERQWEMYEKEVKKQGINPKTKEVTMHELKNYFAKL